MKKIEVVPPYCTALIALGYYDGPTEGVGWLQSGDTVYFRMMGWDKEQWRRLFAAIPLAPSLAINFREKLRNHEVERHPIWAPNAKNELPEVPAMVTMFKHEVQRIVAQTSDLYLVESHNLVSDTPRVLKVEGEELLRVLARMKTNQVITAQSECVLEEFIAGLSVI